MQAILSQQDYDEIIKAPPLKIPEIKDFLPNRKFLLSAKANGDMVLIDVHARSLPYLHNIGNNRNAWYVDVAGYGFRGSVNVKKLRCLPEV